MNHPNPEKFKKKKLSADGDRDSVASAIESLVTRLFNDAAHKTNA